MSNETKNVNNVISDRVIDLDIRFNFKDKTLNAGKLFNTLEEINEADKATFGVEKLHRTHPTQSLCNKFSGRYMSPTFMKSFELCPARALYESLLPRTTGTFTLIGNIYHDIMENFYNLKNEERNEISLERIANAEYDKYMKTNPLECKRAKFYINKHFSTVTDYLDEYTVNGLFDHQKLECKTEFFAKSGELRPLGVELPLPIYVKIDRVDTRKDGLYIIDYKTGTRNPPTLNTFKGYLGQMITYKWIIENMYPAEKVAGCYLITPGISDKFNKNIPVDVNSLTNQSMYIEEILKFSEHFAKVAETKKFECKTNSYCNYCKAQHICPYFVNHSSKEIISYDASYTHIEDDKENKKTENNKDK